MAQGRASFRPPLFATLLAAAGLAVCATAAVWQLGRAEQKRDLLANFEDGARAEPISVTVADHEAPRYRYRRLELAGHYDASRQILLDNRIREGRAGYEVLTPLRQNGFAVLVNRGWVPAGRDRAELPGLRIDDRPRRVSGRLDLLPRPGLRLGGAADDAGEGWPRRLLFPRASDIEAELGYAVRDYQLLLDAGEPDGYVRDWRPAFMKPARHLGYAIQWFSLAIAVAVIYVVLGLRIRRDDDARA